MPRTVEEIMNRELLSVPAGAPTSAMAEAILAFDVSAVPIVDNERRPVGVVSAKELLRARGGSASSAPVVTIAPGMTVRDAAARMAASGQHELVVVDASGRAVGIVSSLDVVRGLIGAAPRHPAAFPHYDAVLQISWSDEEELTLDGVGHAPSLPGLFVLVAGGAGVRDAVVWAEEAPDVRARLESILDEPQHAALARVLARGAIRYRAAYVPDPTRRGAIAQRILESLAHAPMPQPAAVAPRV